MLFFDMLEYRVVPPPAAFDNGNPDAKADTLCVPEPRILKVGRLKRRADFLRVAGRNVKCPTSGLVLQVAPMPANRWGFDIRVGFTTSRKVGGAVDRNRARRKLRALAAKTLPHEAVGAHDYVLIGRKATVSRPFDLLLRDLRFALKRLGVNR